MLLMMSLPGVVFGPLVMAYVDRWPRRVVLVASDWFRAVLVLVLMAWVWPLLGGVPRTAGLWPLYGFVFVIGVVTTFYFPARYALMPSLVPAGELVPANTLFTTSIAVAAFLGRPLGGFVAERFGVEWALGANAVAYVVGAVLIWRIRVERETTATALEQNGWRELRAGVSYLLGHKVALRLVLLSGVFAFLGGVFLVAFVGYAVETLKLGTGGLGYLAAAAGPGAVAGVVLMGRGRAWTKAGWLPVVQLFVAGGVLVGLGWVKTPWLAAPLLTVMGLVVATAMIPIDSLMQEHVEESRRGAVFAVRGMMTSLTMMVAFWLQFGSDVLERTPPPVVLSCLGGVALLAAGVAGFGGRRRR
jgi:MFS family permease